MSDACDVDSPDWVGVHAKCEEEMFKEGLLAVKMSQRNTASIHAPERGLANLSLRLMGFCLKSWNFITKGQFSLIINAPICDAPVDKNTTSK